MPHRRTTAKLYTALFLLSFFGSQAARAGFSLGPDASQYMVLFEGAGKNTLQITNVTVHGNVGVGMIGLATDSGPSTVTGRIDFAAANTNQFSNNNAGDVIAGGVHYNVSAVGNALTTVNNLNSSLGAESGTNVNINLSGNQTYTVNASAGVLDSTGNRVFTVTNFNTTDGNILIINGDAAGDSVVLNFDQSKVGNVNFNNQVKLVGISANQVLYNFVGGSNLTGGPTLQINDNAHGHTSDCNNGVYCVEGNFLDPNGPISVDNSYIVGRVMGGDTHDFQYVSGSTITMPSTVPEPKSPFVLTGFSIAMILAASRRRRKIEI